MTTTFKIGQTVSVPALPNYGKGIIYYIDKTAKYYSHYIKFAERIGKRVFSPDLLKAEAFPVKTAQRYTHDGEGDLETYVPDSPSLQDSFGEMPSYAN